MGTVDETASSFGKLGGTGVAVHVDHAQARAGQASVHAEDRSEVVPAERESRCAKVEFPGLATGGEDPSDAGSLVSVLPDRSILNPFMFFARLPARATSCRTLVASLLLVAMPGAPSRVLAPSDLSGFKAVCVSQNFCDLTKMNYPIHYHDWVK